MSDERVRRLAQDVAEALLEVPGIVRLYRPGMVSGKLLEAGTEFLRRDAEAPLVAVRKRDGAWLVTASIGSDAEHGAGDVCRAAHGAVTRVAERAGVQAEARLTISHIVEGSS